VVEGPPEAGRRASVTQQVLALGLVPPSGWRPSSGTGRLSAECRGRATSHRPEATRVDSGWHSSDLACDTTATWVLRTGLVLVLRAPPVHVVELTVVVFCWRPWLAWLMLLTLSTFEPARPAAQEQLGTDGRASDQRRDAGPPAGRWRATTLSLISAAASRSACSSSGIDPRPRPAD
jgi:hypothetical protein